MLSPGRAGCGLSDPLRSFGCLCESPSTHSLVPQNGVCYTKRARNMEKGEAYVSNDLREILHQILEEADLHQSINVQAAAAFLDNYLDSLEPAPTPDGLEVITLTFDKEGEVEVASTSKLSNLRFRLLDLLRDVAEGTINLAGASGNQLVMILTSLVLLYNISSLTKLEIGLQEAELLLGIYRLICEHEMPTVNRLIEVMSDSFSDAQITDSLDALEQLSCIVLTTDGIVLNETIVFRR
jgi:hypothetical protein